MNPPEWEAAIGPELAGALADRRFEALTPVQEAVLAPGLEGRDLRISSKTGSGKTVAIGFALRKELEGELLGEQEADAPSKARARPRALVIVPTRELATQVRDELAWLFAKTRVRAAAVLGGAAYRDELRALSQRPAIVVGTPGRLKDHLDRGMIDGSKVRAVVLDEADRMLDMGFREELEAILAHAPSERRTHLVSATFPADVQRLADRAQKNPARIEGTPLGEANLDIEHLVHLVRMEERAAAIVNLVLATPEAPSLVFVRRRADVTDLGAELREAGFRVGTLSGEMEQKDRERTLGAFRRGTLDVLVATDVAARGLDVQGVGRVVHAEPPEDPDAYTHRSGRTGRAGQKGTSSILVGPKSLARTTALLRRARVVHRFAPVPTRDEIRAERAERLFLALTEDRDDETLDRDDETLAIRLEKSGLVQRALVRLLGLAKRTFAAAEPQQITPLTPPSAAPEPLRPHTVPPPRPGVPARDKSSDMRRFRVSWGLAHGATARRLVAMLCRRGGIESKHIGAIDLRPTFAVVEVAASVADGFLERAGVPDPRDARVTVQPEALPSRPTVRTLAPPSRKAPFKVPAPAPSRPRVRRDKPGP